MEVSVTTVRKVTVVKLDGELDGKTSAEVQEQVLPVIEEEGKVVMDMSKVTYMSSAGLRMLLSIYRQVTGKNGKVALAGVKEEIRDTMSVTGFLKFFVIHESVDDGIKSLEG